ncbi:MAG: Kelch repeat-containing protein [Spirochaetota bacterium]
MDIKKIVAEIKSIDPDILGINKDLNNAVEIAGISPEMSIASLRKITEKILYDVYEKETKQFPKDSNIQKLKNQLTSKEILPRRIRNHIETIQDFGNMTIHHTKEEIEQEDMEMCFRALVTIYKWYMLNYRKVPSDISSVKEIKEKNNSLQNITDKKITENKISPEIKPEKKVKPPEKNKNFTKDKKDKDDPNAKKIITENTTKKEKTHKTSKTAPETQEKSPDTNKKGGTIKKIFISILILLIVSVGAYFIYSFIINDDANDYTIDEKDNKETETSKSNEELTIPETPSEIRIKSSNSEYITIEWNKSENAQSYNIYRSVNKEADYINIGKTEDTSYKDTDIILDKKYYYKIKALNESGESEFSKLAEVHIPIIPEIWIKYNEKDKIKPSPRRNHSTAYLGDGKLLLFGGRDKNGIKKDTWIYDIKTHKWEKINTTNTPPAREHFAMSYITEGKALMFGGISEDENKLFYDTHIFDLKSKDWTEYNINDTKAPSTRAYHTMSYAGNGLVLLFGGSQASKRRYLSNTYLYDIETKEWKLYDNIPRSPSERISHSMAYLGNNKVILFGGYYNKPLKDLWVFDSDKKNWYKLEGKSNNLQRYNHSIDCINENQIIAFGGYNDNALNDTLLYDFTNNKWTEIETKKDIPPARHNHSISYIGEGKVLMFGGIDNTNTLLGDTLIYYSGNTKGNY